MSGSVVFVFLGLVAAFALGVAVSRAFAPVSEGAEAPAGEAAADVAVPDPAPEAEAEVNTEQGDEHDDVVAPDKSELPPVEAGVDALLPAIQRAYDNADLPGQFEQMEAFKRFVAALSAEDVPFERLIDLTFGGDQGPSSAAAYALRERHELSEQIFTVIGRLNDETYPWTLGFLMDSLRRLPAQPGLIGPLLARSHEWWSKRTALIRTLGSFCDKRVEAGETPSFGSLLDTLPTPRVEEIGKVLKALDRAGLRPLEDAVEAVRGRVVDVHFLKGLGRLWARPAVAGTPLAHEAHRALCEQLALSIAASPGRSVLLVGERGVGKTALLRLAMAQLAEDGWQVFEASARDLTAGMSHLGELEKRVKKLVTKVGSNNRVLWYAPDFHQFIQAGQHKHSPEGIYDYVRGDIASGRLVVVGETDPRAFEGLLTERPRIRLDFEVLNVPALNDAETLALAQRHAARLASEPLPGNRPGTPRVTMDNLPLADALNLSRQYLAEVEGPGNLLGLLDLTQERLLRAGPGDEITLSLDDVLDTLSMLSGMPRRILDDRAALDTASVASYFTDRVKGQSEAVKCLVDRIAMIKAGLTDPSRPLGVFLFVGPSGSGKTELAKTLAQYLFGSGERLVRLDMSELQSPNAIGRIVGEGELGGQRSLTSIVRSNPFSVVLLDEFEKAHSQIWDLFLQVFDDGRLTDQRGNTVDFRHCIIILTSNLGAAIDASSGMGFRQAAGGFSPANVDRQLRQTFRPEFLNRLDRVVTFNPLSRAVMREVLNRELERVLARRGLRTREWAVEWDESALEFLLDKGYSAELGARPLKRAVERHLLAPLSHTIVSRRFPAGDQFLFLSQRDGRLHAQFIDPDGGGPAAPTTDRAAAPSPSSLTLKGMVLGSRGTRAEVDALDEAMCALNGVVDGDGWRALNETLYAEMNGDGFWSASTRHRTLGRIELMDRIRSARDNASSLLERLRGPAGTARTAYSADLVARLAERLYLLATAADGANRDVSPDAFVRIERGTARAAQSDLLDEFHDGLIGMYEAWAIKRGMRLQRLTAAIDGANSGTNTGTVDLAVNGFGALDLLRPDAGWHLFERSEGAALNEQVRVLVRIAAQPHEPAHNERALRGQIEAAFGSTGDGRQDPTAPPAIVRRYREQPSPLVRDTARGWRSGRLDLVLAGNFDVME